MVCFNGASLVWIASLAEQSRVRKSYTWSKDKQSVQFLNGVPLVYIASLAEQSRVRKYYTWAKDKQSVQFLNGVPLVYIASLAEQSRVDSLTPGLRTNKVFNFSMVYLLSTLPLWLSSLG